MPDDLLRFVAGPAPYSGWWLVAGLGGLVLAAGWVGGIWVATRPAERLRTAALTRGLHLRGLRRRFARRARAVRGGLGDGRLTAAQAAAEFDGVLRRFLVASTGVAAHTAYPDDLRDGAAGAAAPLLTALADARFNHTSGVDVGRTGAAVEQMIRRWS